MVCVMFGIPLTRTGMLWAAGLEFDPGLRPIFVWIWTFLYFGGILFLSQWPLKDKLEGRRLVGSIAVGIQAFSAFAALDEEFAGRRLEALIIPIGIVLIIIGTFRFLQHQEQQRRMENPE